MNNKYKDMSADRLAVISNLRHLASQLVIAFHVAHSIDKVNQESMKEIRQDIQKSFTATNNELERLGEKRMEL